MCLKCNKKSEKNMTISNLYNIKIYIKDAYKELLKKDVNQRIVLEIMNDSKRLFPENYSYIEEQSNNESDFISETNAKFDSKLLFEKEQCEALAISKDNLAEFMAKVCEETNDIYEAIMNNDVTQLKNTIFYKEMKKRINSANENENIILFIPFVYTMDFEDSIFSNFGADIFNYIYNNLVKNCDIMLKNNMVYIIYPNYENKIVIKKLSGELGTEFISGDYLKEYIAFSITK